MHRTARYASALGFSLALHGWLLYLAWPTPLQRLVPAVVYVTARLAQNDSVAKFPPPQPPLLPKLQVRPQKKSPQTAPKPINDEPANASLPADSLWAEPSTEIKVDKPADAINSSAPAVAPPLPSPDGYYPFEDVDQPATPLGDWLIDGNVLPRGAIVRIELWLWISANGKIDHWELGPDTPINPELERALAELDQTPVQPALRNNIAVPSFRRLEVFISRE